MKKLLTASVAVLLLSAGMVAADGTAASDTDNITPEDLKKQTHCPVMGGKIDSAVYTDIHGQRVYHCCPGCSEPLEEDPDKYFKQAAKDSILFENIQTIDPICGMKPVKDFFLYHEGRGLYFCNDGCKIRFTETPDKYLSRLTATDGSEDKSKEKHKHDDDHDHDHSHGDGHKH